MSTENVGGRVAVSKRVRFEVFKRDSFKCVYCGAVAPEVLLQIDHVKPLAEGGDDDILNLVTACAPCNSGKGARQLSDHSAIEKQRAQSEELQERREQLEMMLEWRRGLQDLKDTEVEETAKRWIEITEGYSLNDFGRDQLRRLIRQHGLTRVLDAMESVESYLKRGEDGHFLKESVERAFSMISRVISVAKTTERKPYWRDIAYARGILRRRLSWMREQDAIWLLEQAVLVGYDVEDLKAMAKVARSWSQWSNDMDQMILKAEKKG